MDRKNKEWAQIKAAQAGDKRAFGLLVREHQKRLFGFIYSLTGSFDQTEDIVQEAFVKAYQAIDRFEEGRELYPWLSTIARNLAFNQMSRERKSESLDRVAEKGFDPETDTLNPLDKLMESEGQQRFYNALIDLPEVYRVVFVLRHYEDMEYKEIARELKIKPGTVDSRLYRARKMLSEALKDLL